MDSSPVSCEWRTLASPGIRKSAVTSTCRCVAGCTTYAAGVLEGSILANRAYRRVVDRDWRITGTSMRSRGSIGLLLSILDLSRRAEAAQSPMSTVQRDASPQGTALLDGQARPRRMRLNLMILQRFRGQMLVVGQTDHSRQARLPVLGQ